MCDDDDECDVCVWEVWCVVPEPGFAVAVVGVVTAVEEVLGAGATFVVEGVVVEEELLAGGSRPASNTLNRVDN